jgi:hypothetical protein
MPLWVPHQVTTVRESVRFILYSICREAIPVSTYVPLSSIAYSSLGCPDPSQLENFHHPQCTLPATFTKLHLIGAGIGGQFAHVPSSYVASKFIRKKGTTSKVPALVTVFLPHALKTAAA